MRYFTGDALFSSGTSGLLCSCCKCLKSIVGAVHRLDIETVRNTDEPILTLKTNTRTGALCCSFFVMFFFTYFIFLSTSCLHFVPEHLRCVGWTQVVSDAKLNHSFGQRLVLLEIVVLPTKLCAATLMLWLIKQTSLMDW